MTVWIWAVCVAAGIGLVGIVYMALRLRPPRWAHRQTRTVRGHYAPEPRIAVIELPPPDDLQARGAAIAAAIKAGQTPLIWNQLTGGEREWIRRHRSKVLDAEDGILGNRKERRRIRRQIGGRHG